MDAVQSSDYLGNLRRQEAGQALGMAQQEIEKLLSTSEDRRVLQDMANVLVKSGVGVPQDAGIVSKPTQVSVTQQTQVER